MFVPRPYDPSFAARVVEAGKRGLDTIEIAAELGVSFADFVAWADAHDSFATALADAETQAGAWWHGQPERARLNNEPFRPSIWAKVMAHRYRRTPNSRRQAPEKPAAKPVVRVRYELPDNGKERPLAGRRRG